MQTKVLEVYDISIQFEGIVALDGVSFDMDPGTILGLIGPNGAGKTTLFNCLSRFCSPDSGDIIFQGKSILQRPAHRIRDFESVSCAISRTDSEPTAKRANYVGTCREGGTVPGSCRRLTADDIIVCLPQRTAGGIGRDESILAGGAGAYHRRLRLAVKNSDASDHRL